MKKSIFSGVALFAILAALLLAIMAAADISERNECQQWQGEAREYAAAGYYITAWQAAQCAAQGIEIDAPVK